MNQFEDKLPCVIDNCLKYPMCKNRKFITCTPLREYADDLILIDNDTKLWEVFYKLFPSLLGIKLEEAPKDSKITNVKDTLLLYEGKEWEIVSDKYSSKYINKYSK